MLQCSCLIFNIFPIFERERELKAQKKKTKQNKTNKQTKPRLLPQNLEHSFCPNLCSFMVMIGPNFAKSFLNHNLAIFFLIQTTHFQTVPHNRNKFNPLVGFYNHVFVCDTYHYQLYIANIIRKRKNKKCVSSNGK